ncbi:MAG TPA: O-methyltransferase [Rhabdochlamydiaceae bacterium]|nr:O-methyltransferase [Rhabdochlamydiaceae bacterium]
MEDRNCTIKNYIASYFAKETEELIHARENSSKQGLPNIHVPSHVGKMIYLLTKLRQPQKVLEIGTLGGYSTLWILRALQPTARLISLELEPEHAQLAKSHLRDYENQFEIRVGDAAETLQSMVGEEPFDLVFIDGHKEEYSTYLKLVLPLTTSGTLILTDNLIPKGEAVDNPNPRNKEATAVYKFNRELAAHPNLETILSTTIVGETGRIDALGISLVR